MYKIGLMKKLLGSIVATVAFLSLAPVAFAQVGITPGGDFAALAFNKDDVAGIVGALISLIFIVAVVIALFYLLWGAVRWILSGGDKAAVEGARNMIIAAIVGLVVLFLAFLLINVLLAFFNVDIGSLTVPTINTAT